MTGPSSEPRPGAVLASGASVARWMRGAGLAVALLASTAAAGPDATALAGTLGELQAERTRLQALPLWAGLRTLGLQVVAEAVETEAQALREAGCTLAQGWLHGRPMDAQALWAHCRAAPASDGAGGERPAGA